MSYEDYCKVDVVGRGGQFGARGGRQASLANPNPNTNPNPNQVHMRIARVLAPEMSRDDMEQADTDRYRC
eukprot:scaffold52176_cov49-Phaeocystis_antarctica.AAC.1